MAIKFSTALREGLVVSGPLRTLLNECVVRIYSGSVPVSPDSAIGSAVLLAEISAGGTGTPLTFESAAPNGVLSKSVAENWTGTVIANGSPTFFRLVKPGDTGNAGTTDVRLQGTAGSPGNDMVITELPLITGAPQSFDFFQIAIPEQ
ncbi:hypothetical protein BVH03_21875 [Pseudomonas sp. PA15(2017)]|uniref:hypothetical protein n=1 Tax=Pseudomonas sp. PA15(2017) TaxID=1932111 RepID=UPI0009633559|nr:hypothetical protein [Pseudomonas sp. PA15(2017)]OLU22904.1 hypothetical protein BVH03_21875 [Pseudomonas sp. PA15(2017)]